MNDRELRGLIQRLILAELARRGQRYVPVMSSNRHCHLSQPDVERLFGPGYRLTKMRDLVQPGQYACNERVTILTPKGSMALRVVGPARKETQIELSLSDCARLGLAPPIRMSGQLEDTPGCVLQNGDRQIQLPRGVIVAARHLHLSPEEAEAFGLKDGDTVSLLAEGPRACRLDQVIVRSGPGHVMEVHLDKDEANACGLEDGSLCRLILPWESIRPAPVIPERREPRAPEKRNTMLDWSGEARKLITEEDVVRAAGRGITLIRYGKDAVLTPLARDAARDRGIELAVLPE